MKRWWWYIQKKRGQKSQGKFEQLNQAVIIRVEAKGATGSLEKGRRQITVGLVWHPKEHGIH